MSKKIAKKCCDEEQKNVITKYWKLFAAIAALIAGAFGINLSGGPGEISTVLDSMDRDLQTVETKNVPVTSVKVPVLDKKGKVEVILPVKEDEATTPETPALHDGTDSEPPAPDVSSTAGEEVVHDIFQAGKLEVLDPAYSLDRQGLASTVEMGRKNNVSAETILAMLKGEEWPEN